MDHLSNSNYILTSNGELYHYGVKGQKWGVRRYQNPDGTLTADGRKRAKQEYKEDNKKAFELGKDASISGHAAAGSMRRTVRLENKLDKQLEKDPDGISERTKKLGQKWQASSETTMQLTKKYMEAKTTAEEHCKSLIDKYGEEAVSSIKYRDVKMPKGKYSPDSFKTMNERVNTLSDWAKAGAATLASQALAMALGSPIALYYYPKGAAGRGNDIEYRTYRSNLEVQKQVRKVADRKGREDE